jgi:hypothetical protein
MVDGRFQPFLFFPISILAYSLNFMPDSEDFFSNDSPEPCPGRVDLQSPDTVDPLQILLFETSPYGNIDAIVQHDGKTIYFYLHPRETPERFSPKACWVRNLQTGPLVIQHEELLAGQPVALPRTHTVQRQPGSLPRPEQLEIVWFEEGNGAALLEHRPQPEGGSTPQTLAVIPPWSGMDGFHGYALECAADSPVCWPLPRNPKLQQRIERAADFWRSFTQPPDPFLVLRDQILDRYHIHFLGSPPHSVTPPATTQTGSWQYFNIGGQRFPPRGLIQYTLADREVIATVGMSLCPQPNVELDTTEPENFRRVELGIEVTGQRLKDCHDPDLLNKVRQQIASMAAYPWKHFRWLKSSDTVQLAGLNRLTDSGNPFRLGVGENPLQGLSYRADPIQLLWFGWPH